MAEDVPTPEVPEVRLDKGEAAAGPQDQVPSSVHHQETVVSLPDASRPPSPTDTAPQPWASPAAAPAPSAPAAAPLASYPPPNPFAAPAQPQPYAAPAQPQPYVQDGAVPPPPIAPDGPGQLPYGYGYPGGPVGPGGYPGGPGGVAGGGYGYPPQQVGPGVPGGVPGYYGWTGMRPENNGMGIASLVCGIVAAAVFCLWPLAIILGVLAVIFGVIGRAKAKRGEASNPGYALAGIICGAAGFVLGIGMVVLLVVT